MSGKEKLLQLEKEGKYVFHGSLLSDIKSLEPRQGRHIPDISKSEIILDGNPAVSATPYAEFAIFRAVVNKENTQFTFGSGFGFNNSGEKEFFVSSKEVLEVVKNKKGFVYVFNKSEFEPYSRDGKANNSVMEWRSYKEVTPVDIVDVNYHDLPSEDIIEIRQFNLA